MQNDQSTREMNKLYEHHKTYVRDDCYVCKEAFIPISDTRLDGPIGYEIIEECPSCKFYRTSAYSQEWVQVVLG